MKVDRRRGFTLVELIGVMAGIQIALAFSALLLIAALRADQVTATGIDRIRRHVALADTLRADVASAIDAPEQAVGYESGPDCLILQQGEDSYIVYQWHNGKFDRIENRTGSATTQPLPLGTTDTQISFSKGGPRNAVIVLHVRDVVPSGAIRAIDIAATLGSGRK